MASLVALVELFAPFELLITKISIVFDRALKLKLWYILLQINSVPLGLYKKPSVFTTLVKTYLYVAAQKLLTWTVFFVCFPRGVPSSGGSLWSLQLCIMVQSVYHSRSWGEDNESPVVSACQTWDRACTQECRRGPGKNPSSLIAFVWNRVSATSRWKWRKC